MHQLAASDLHLGTGAIPRLRVHGVLEPMGSNRLQFDHAVQMAREVLGPETLKTLHLKKNLDFAFDEERRPESGLAAYPDQRSHAGAAELALSPGRFYTLPPGDVVDHRPVGLRENFHRRGSAQHDQRPKNRSYHHPGRSGRIRLQEQQGPDQSAPDRTRRRLLPHRTQRGSPSGPGRDPGG